MQHRYGKFKVEGVTWHFARCQVSGYVTRANADPKRAEADADAIDAEFKKAKETAEASGENFSPNVWVPVNTSVANRIYNDDIPIQCRVWSVPTDTDLSRLAVVGPDREIFDEVFKDEYDAIIEARKLNGDSVPGYK
ncbi:hypothetical protein [Azospirillum palustre]|uniref:hypothetical protein n=1 Tax=Azospirillum palustre TaxID=2044885 RepID=UPI0011775E02|nr:hypothetical protein [Azospirillum palustre]